MTKTGEILNDLRNIEYHDLKYKDLKIDYIFLLDEIKYYLSKIKQCLSFDESKEYFSGLLELEEILEIIEYKLRIGLPDEFQNVIYNLDRIDDVWLQERIFNILRDDDISTILNSRII